MPKGRLTRWWRRLNQVLPAYGFTIKDTQQSPGLDRRGVRRAGQRVLEGQGAEPFKLEEDKYRFQLGEMTGGKTSITLFDWDRNLSHPVSSPRCTSACPRRLPRAWPIRGQVQHGNRASRPCFGVRLPQGQRAEQVARTEYLMMPDPHRQGLVPLPN